MEQQGQGLEKSFVIHSSAQQPGWGVRKFKGKKKKKKVIARWEN